MYMNSSVFFLVLAFGMNVSAQQGTLVVEIQNIQQKEGFIEISLYNNESTFLQEGMAYQMKRVKVGNEQKMTIHFESLPLGKYAAAGFHDVNGDEIFDRNILGIPKEPYLVYGCNGCIRLRKPYFEEASFDFTQHEQVISIVLQ